MRACLALLALTACPIPPAYVTRHGLEVERPAPPPTCAEVEQWTEALAAMWRASPCPEVASRDILAAIRYSHDAGLGARLYWRDPPMSTGRMLQARSESAYQHELSHALIDGYRLAPWDEAAHHRLMCRCGLPVGAAVCEALR